MHQYLRGFFEGALEVDPHSWHAKWYNFWRDHAKYKATGYKENLCHYVRVLLIWAPIMWIRYGRIGKVPSWMPAALVIIAGVLWAGFTLIPTITQLVLIGVGVIAAAVGLFATGVLIHDKNPERAQRIVSAIFKPVTLPLSWAQGKIKRSFDLNEERIDGFIDWFFDTRVLRVVSPARVAFASFIALMAVLSPQFLFTVLVIMVVASAALGILTGVVALADWLDSRKTRTGSDPKPPGVVRKAAGGVTGTIKLGGHYVMAKKRGICPFISFKEETAKQTA